jgi:hypothetical protein
VILKDDRKTAMLMKRGGFLSNDFSGTFPESAKIFHPSMVAWSKSVAGRHMTGTPKAA